MRLFFIKGSFGCLFTLYNIFFAFFIFHIICVEMDFENLAVKRNVNKEKYEDRTFNRLLQNIFTAVYSKSKREGLDVKQRRNFKISYLKCTVCGSIMPIPRRFGRFREKNHIKTMYCYKCDTERDFLENAEDKRYSDALPDTYEPETDIPASMDLDTSTHRFEHRCRYEYRCECRREDRN